jgi:hypothetical protein
MGLLAALRSLFRGSHAAPKHAAWNDAVDIAALTLPEIAAGLQPVLFVTHDLGVGDGLGGWVFLGSDGTVGREPTAIAKVELLKLDPTLAEVTDLPVGWQASREAPGKPWRREKL